VLKIAGSHEDPGAWRGAVAIQRLAAQAGLTPEVVLARRLEHPGADTPIEDAMALGDFYQQMRTGPLRLGTPDGQWAFGLALVKESLADQKD
jgi:hypothetical protein